MLTRIIWSFCHFLTLQYLIFTGTIILNASKPVGVNATFRVEDPNKPPDPNVEKALNDRLLLKNYDTRFTLENTKPLDLEEFNLQVSLSCTFGE